MTVRVISELYYKWKWRIIENCLRHRIPRHAKKKCLASTVVFSLTLNSGFEILHQPQKGEKYKITKVTWNNCSNLFWFGSILFLSKQVSEENELYNEQRQKIFNEAQSMIKSFPASVVALEILTKAFLQSLTSSRKCCITIEIGVTQSGRYPQCWILYRSI